jgi:hypothetical protein
MWFDRGPFGENSFCMLLFYLDKRLNFGHWQVILIEDSFTNQLQVLPGLKRGLPCQVPPNVKVLP